MLSPSYPLNKATKNPELLQSLRSPSGFMRVPQAPMNSVGACASSLISLADVAPSMLLDLPGLRRPRMVLWTAADTATMPAWQVLDGFGPGALMTTRKLDELNADRSAAERRSVADCLTPFDVDASGTVVGDGASGMVVTTLDVALRHQLDITSIIVGWGQSGETGGKAHFAGVGFGGENALIQAFELARDAHGYGVADFGYLAAHATGTRTNSKTDLTSVAIAREVALQRAAVGRCRRSGSGPRRRWATVTRWATPASRRSPTPSGSCSVSRRSGCRRCDSSIRSSAMWSTSTICVPIWCRGTLTEVRSARPRASAATTSDRIAVGPRRLVGRYECDPDDLAAYLERWPELRRERALRERRSRITRGDTLRLALEHRWPS